MSTTIELIDQLLEQMARVEQILKEMGYCECGYAHKRGQVECDER